MLRAMINKIKLEAERVAKQRLYAQMLKDGITTKAIKEKVQSEITDLTIQIYGKR